MAKENKKNIYLTTRKNKNGGKNSWFIVDKSSKVDFELKTKQEAIKYIKANYQDVIVLVQGDDRKWSYQMVINKGTIKEVNMRGKSKMDKESIDGLKSVYNYQYILKLTEEQKKANIAKEAKLKAKEDKLKAKAKRLNAKEKSLKEAKTSKASTSSKTTTVKETNVEKGFSFEAKVIMAFFAIQFVATIALIIELVVLL